MAKITKKKLDKIFKKVNKKFRKDVQDLVKAVAKEKAGDAGADSIVIDDISVEIAFENPERKASIAKSESAALTRCIYYCYVIGGTRICRKICY